MPESVARYPALVKLLVAIVGAALFALASAVLFDGDVEHLLLTYNTPIAIPFIAYGFDQFTQRPRLAGRLILVDASVITLALLRAVVPVPFISGHALFLTYALLRSRSCLTRLLCLIVFAQVAVLKLFVWHDSTFWGGLALGGLVYCLTRVWCQALESGTPPG